MDAHSESQNEPTCGCQSLGSPVEGVLWGGEGSPEVQRCDTHLGGPIYDCDGAAAKAMSDLGYDVYQDPKEDYRFFAHG